MLFSTEGAAGLRNLEESGWATLPPLSGPSHFIVNRDLAEYIVRDWIADAGYYGFVTRFEITAACSAKFPPEYIDDTDDAVLMVPADDLDYFNTQIVGKIKPVQACKSHKVVDLNRALSELEINV